jgi:hypothetical protein
MYMQRNVLQQNYIDDRLFELNFKFILCKI